MFEQKPNGVVDAVGLQGQIGQRHRKIGSLGVTLVTLLRQFPGFFGG